MNLEMNIVYIYINTIFDRPVWIKFWNMPSIVHSQQNVNTHSATIDSKLQSIRQFGFLAMLIQQAVRLA